MYVVVKIQRDNDTRIYSAICEEIELMLESPSYDRLIARIREWAPVLMEAKGFPRSTGFCLITKERFIERPASTGYAEGLSIEAKYNNLSPEYRKIVDDFIDFLHYRQNHQKNEREDSCL